MRAGAPNAPNTKFQTSFKPNYGIRFFKHIPGAEKRCEVVAEAKRLRRASPTTDERRSLQRISRELAAKVYFNKRGQPFNPKSVRAMLERK